LQKIFAWLLPLTQVPGCGTAFPEGCKAPSENSFHLVQRGEMTLPLAKNVDTLLSRVSVESASLPRFGTLLAKNMDQAQGLMSNGGQGQGWWT
jgi:hypothetical protein